MTKEIDFIKRKFEEIFGTYEWYESENNTAEYENLWKGFAKGCVCCEIYPLPLDEIIQEKKEISTDEILTFLIPSESDEFLKAKENFKWTLDLEMFSKFWGLYVMKLPIPNDIWEYVYTNKDKMPNGLEFPMRILAGAPIEQDDSVRQMVFAEVM